MFRATRCHHQEKQLYLCDIWYLLFCTVDCLVCTKLALFSSLSGRHVRLTTDALLVTKSGSGAMPPIPLYAFVACTRDNLTFTFSQNIALIHIPRYITRN